MEKLLDRLEICLLFISKAKSELEEKGTIQELRLIVNELMSFTYTFESDLFILTQLSYDFYTKNSDLAIRNTCLFDSRKLVKKYNLGESIFNLWKDRLVEMSEHEKHSAMMFALDYSPRTYKIRTWNEEGIENFDKEKLLAAANQIIIDACEVIDIHLFDDHELVDLETLRYLSLDDHMVESQQELSFYDSFIKGKATLKDWKLNPGTGFRSYFEYVERGSLEGLEAINTHQRKLFSQAKTEELLILQDEINNLPEPYRYENAIAQLSIVRKFLSGDFSQLDYRRLNQVIEFSDPEEVILELDDMKRFDIYNYEKYLPYTGKNNKRSPRLVAEILVDYNAFLERITDQYNVNVISTSIEEKVLEPYEEIKIKAYDAKDKPVALPNSLPKPPSFKMKFKNQKESVLKKVTSELSKYDFIDLDKHTIGELNDILFCNNYREIDQPIQFGSNTNFCCLILKEFFPYFENMNAASIAQSGLFKTKSGKLLTQTNFNKSVKDVTKKEEELAEIKKIIRQLEEKNSKSSKN